MRFKALSSFVAAAAMVSLAGCAGDGTNPLTTGAVSQQKKVAAVAIDPACLALQNRIELLRGEGTVGRVEKAATGKTKTVVIKRASLTKVAELNQANAEFQARCSKLPKAAMVAPKPLTAAQSAATAAATRATVKKVQQVSAAAVKKQ